MGFVKISSSGVLYVIKKVIGILLLVALSLLFIYSAYSKSGLVFIHGNLYNDGKAFDNFQWTFLDLGFNSIFITGIIARLMIGFEFMLGIFLLFHIYLRAFTYKAVIGILLFFIAYLIVVIVKQGNTGNCGCFGNEIAMTPLAAIWKNLILSLITLILWFIYPVKPYRRQEYFCLVLGLIALATPFIAKPIYTHTAPDAFKNKINLDLLYKFDPVPNVELKKGKYIIAFMSLTCPHCRKAAYLLQIIKREHPEFPIYFVLVGHESLIKNFFDETQSSGMPYLFYKHSPEFDTLIQAGVKTGEHSGVPAIYWINNGEIEYESTYYTLDPNIIKQWLENKYK